MSNTAEQAGTAAVKIYTIPLKHRNNTRIVDIASLLMLLISCIVFLFAGVTKQQVVTIVSSSALLLLTGYWLYRAFINRQAFTYLNMLITLVAIYWVIQGTTLSVFIGIMLAIAALFEKRLKRQHTAYISKSGVAITTNFSTMLGWQQLANVVIKDGLLTVDTRTNKLYQKELSGDFTIQQEAEINEFCRLHLASIS